LGSEIFHNGSLFFADIFPADFREFVDHQDYFLPDYFRIILKPVLKVLS
jgi:hypothetical protein